jgi:hypothetical protein
MAKAKATRSTAVPKGWEERYRILTGLTDAFCREHLNEEYAELARYAIAALCRKRPSPLASGQPQSWACGVLYALGQLNFLSDPASTPYMTLQDLCTRFGVSASTGGAKAKQVREALGMRQFDHRWTLPSRLAEMGVLWMVEVNGLIADARQLPRALQVEAAERGVIPYVWADRHRSADDGERQAILDRYDAFRKVSTDLQTKLASQALAGDALDIARRLGVLGTEEEKVTIDLDDLTPALDLALYEPGPDGTNAIQRHLAAEAGTMTPLERQVAEAMAAARFGVYSVSDWHPVTGLWLQEVGGGDRIWLVDRSLEAGAVPGLQLALRVFRPEAFFMSTGLAVRVDDQDLAAARKNAAAPSAEAILKAVLSNPTQ